MESYDFIVIGAGMGGLSTANFLAKFGKRVLVLEKHSIPGGLVTSFARPGIHFDLGLHGLYELQENQAIWQFLEYFGAKRVETTPCRGDLVCYAQDQRYVFRPGQIREDFLRQFPKDTAGLNRLFDRMEQINQEMFSGREAPEPPYDMALLELIRFGYNSLRDKPALMRYGRKDAARVLDSLELSPRIKQVIYSLCPYPMVFLAFAYQWGVLGRGVYPTGGMQALPDAAAESFQGRGGQLLLSEEVVKIKVKDGAAIGVETACGRTFYGRVISCVSPHYTLRWLRDSQNQTRRLKKTIAQRSVFPSICALFLGMDDSWDSGGAETITLSSHGEWLKRPDEQTAQSAPIVLHIYPKKAGDRLTPLVALMPLPYDYESCWNTTADRQRGPRYRKLKREVEQTMLHRLAERLDPSFEAALVSHELATPLTFERYTYNHKGSFMGWSQEAGDYGRYLRQTTPIRDLYFAGQWVFPGFGVAGVMASGYYLARQILKEDGIDLKRDFTEHFH